MDEDNLSKYNSVKNKLDVIYDHITAQKAYELRANATGMNTVINQQYIYIFFEFRETTRISKYNKKACDDDDERCLFCGIVGRRKVLTPYFQTGPLSEILTIANLRHAASKV